MCFFYTDNVEENNLSLHHAVLHVSVGVVAAVKVGIGGPTGIGRCSFREDLVVDAHPHTWDSCHAGCLSRKTAFHPVGRKVPVGGGTTGGSAEVKPRLAVGAWSVVCHACVRGHRFSELTGMTSWSALTTWTAWTSVGVNGTVAVTVVALSHVVVTVRDVRTLRAVHLGEGVDVLKLGSTEVALVAANWGSSSSESTTTASTSTPTSSAAVAVLRKGRIFTRKLRLDTLAVRRVANRREDRSDRLDKLCISNAGMQRVRSTHKQSLVDVAVVKDGLNDVVSVRVSQELLQS